MLEEKIKEILIDNLGLDEEMITLDANLVDDFGADSLDLVEIQLILQEEFDISIKDEEMEAAGTVKDLIKLIKEKTKK